MVLTRNENYWEKGADGKALPYLDKIVLRIITDDSVRLIEIQSGNTMLSVRVPAESMDIVQKDPNVLEFMSAVGAGGPKVPLRQQDVAQVVQ